MRSPSLLLAVGLLFALSLPAFCDNLLTNTDFKNDSQGWHGDGHVVYLKPDGTEGDQTDTGVTPVLKIALAKGQPHAVYEVLRSKDAIGTLHASVEVFASTDFKRSTHADDYVVQDSFTMTVTDFMIRMSPDFWEQDASLTPGNWKTVHADYTALQAVDERAIYFQVPPGDGFVYIRNPALTP
jgi:hypothetical protein